jgi:hypothetical protein
MTDDDRSDDRSLLNRILTILLGLPWSEALREAWKIAHKAMQRRLSAGMYQVLAYESTLELHDRTGKRATFRKRERVRYLQDHVIAYQDQAWGDGEILLNYRCSPGTAVDRYRLGHKTYVLISRREVKNRGDQEQFSIEWNIRNGFVRQTEQWETHIA